MRKTWFVITAAIFVPFGLISLLAPHVVTGWYGGEINDHGALWARYYGAAILFAGLIAWFARGVRNIDVLRFVALSLLILVSINLVVSIHAEVQGSLNALHWGTIAGQVLLVVVWGYYRFAGLVDNEPDGMDPATPPAAGS